MKKQQQQKINIRTNKAGEAVFYTGRHRATDKEKKAFLKEHAQQPPPNLNKADRQTLGRIKGGLARAAESKNARIDGKFIEGGYSRAAKRLGIDIQEIIKDAGAKNLKDFFSKNEGFKDAFDDIMNGVGLPMWFDGKTSDNAIKDFTGNKIIVNGKEVSKAQARALLSKTITDINLEFAPVSVALKLEFKGKDALIINLPELEYYEGADENEFAETYSENFKIYTSSAKKKS